MSSYYSDVQYKYETSYKIDGVDYKLFIPRLPREDFQRMALEAVYDDVLKKDYKEVYDIFEKNKYSNFQEKVEGLVHAMKEVNGKNWNSSQYIWFYDNYFDNYFAIAPEPVYVPNLDYSSYTNTGNNKKSFDIQAMFEAIGDDSDEESSDENKSKNNEKVSATTVFPSAFDLLYGDDDEEDYSSSDECSNKKIDETELRKIKNAESKPLSKAEAKSVNKLAKEQLKAVQKQEKQAAKDAIKASKQAAKDVIKASKQAEKEAIKANKISSRKNTGGSKKNKNQKNKTKKGTQKKYKK